MILAKRIDGQTHTEDNHWWRIYEDGDLIAKIKVIPKYRYSALFSGFIYVSKHSFTLKSVNLDINQASLSFFNTFSVIQDYKLINDTVLVPSRQEFYYKTKKDC